MEHVRAALNQNRRKTVRKLSQELDLNRNSVHKMVKKMGMTKVSCKFVPRVLTDAMKAERKRVCELNLASFAADPMMLSKVVTGDESWFSVFDPETKQGSAQWKLSTEPRPTKALRNRSECKTMLTCFFDEKGSILPPRTTVVTEGYCQTIKNLKERLRKKRPELWKRQNPDQS